MVGAEKGQDQLPISRPCRVGSAHFGIENKMMQRANWVLLELSEIFVRRSRGRRIDSCWRALRHARELDRREKRIRKKLETLRRLLEERR